MNDGVKFHKHLFKNLIFLSKTKVIDSIFHFETKLVIHSSHTNFFYGKKNDYSLNYNMI